MDLYQVCSYDAPWVRTGPALGVKSWNVRTEKKISKFFFSETARPIALMLGVYKISSWISTKFVSYDAPAVKTGPAPGVTIWNIGTKKAHLQNSSSLKLEGVELCSYDAPRVKIGSDPGSQVGT